MTIEQCLAELFRLAQTQSINAKALALSCIKEFNPTRNAEISDALLLKFRDMPVHNETATFIFEELARDVLHRA